MPQLDDQQKSALKPWLQSQTDFTECVHSSQLDEALEIRMGQLDGEVLTFVGDAESFLVWEAGFYEVDTGDPISRLWAWQGTEETLPRLLQDSLERQVGQILKVECFRKSGFSRKLLKQAGFTLERYRLRLEPRQHDLSEERFQDFEFRQASELDRTFLCSLAANHVRHTLPPSAQDRVQEYTRSALENFRSLDLSDESPYTLFVCERRSSRRSIGYILLREENDGSILLHDMGVRQKEWGRFVGHFMVRSVENLLVDLGYELLVSEISAANRRSYLGAVRQIQFRPFLEFWQKKT